MRLIKAFRSIFFALQIVAWAACPAFSQTPPDWTYGYVPTQAEWNAAFAGKQDYLGAPSCLVTGCTMISGTLITNASGTSGAGFNLPPGTAPTSPNNGDMWTTSSGLFVRINGSTVSLGVAALPLAGGTMTGEIITAASTTGGAGLNLPAGTAPTAPNNGDVWTTSSGMFVRINGSTVGPLGSSSATMTSANVINGTGLTETGTCNSTTAISCTLAIDKATGANFLAGTSNKVLTADNVYQSYVVVTYAASQVLDMSTFINAQVTMTGNITSVTINNIKAGQSGSIEFVQDGTGSRTLPGTFNSNFKFPAGVQPVLSTAPNAADTIFYTCYATNYCLASLTKNFS